MNCTEYYQELHIAQGDFFGFVSKSDAFSLQAESHHFLGEIEIWLDVIGRAHENLLARKAAAEYQSALLLIVTGQNRAAFAALRSTLELGLACVEHSACLKSHLRWLRGQQDIIWRSLIDDESGVLSKSFCALFLEDLADEIAHIRTLTQTVYRNCSEYVHGNPRLDASLPALLEHSLEAFTRWHELAKSVRYVLHFAFSMRYLASVDISHNPRLESVISENVGHIQAIRSLLSR